MFLDASVIVAILGREPGFEEIEKRLSVSDVAFFVSPLVKFEASVALARQKASVAAPNTKPSPALLQQAELAVEAFVDDLSVQEVPISPEIGKRAINASVAYGKAVGHVADLNFGDCFAYACAKVLGVTLLYKGNDFAHTDLA
ncbi:type II toxin-antitoxin system VapC family toxin [Mesorhizobium sp. M9A.F.Ca.ET.002.03.1.2]|uniref:type II toxin-antitoxin system VapC family toxin n=1 Tax=Mesorhizobium sp. M9A.F.Ca.ET.002.03.1.2 TaxID=2493668 RepID=UPI000F74C632|nr:type II toxin-antitoxin system VapC family toxin [Mesorhizobium sp. M9A.F.Ca.ET.002.03.1.2]AZN98861.1 type II toxin-antitoxin system VapC family toxin [Mesorhizobium sp. M9A.F.Ca.ET.002.03.1.2]